MMTEKVLMAEVATLYYQKNMTQQEIAERMRLTRQAVSKLLSDAIAEKVVEIIIHNPVEDRKDLEKQICDAFGIRNCIALSVSGRDALTHRTMVVQAAVNYVMPIIQKGNQKIAISWGRTIQEFINVFPEMVTTRNMVFPLFGATDTEHSYFSSNELARKFADKLNATPKCAWFPYLADGEEDCNLIKQLSCYQKIQQLWDSADLAILGIGNAEILEIFGSVFGYSDIHNQAIGDIATHFFDKDGSVLNLYENTLCAPVNSIKNAKETIAIACGDEKAEAISGALRTNVIDTLITDEYTARKILEYR